MRSRHSQRGVALIIVIWIATLLTLLASSFIHAMRSDIQIVGNSVQRARLEAAAHAGVQRAILEFMKPPQLAGRWTTDGTPNAWAFRGNALEVTITDESAKIDINVAPDALVRALLMAQGVPEVEAIALTDAILDWKDGDTLKRTRGAEDAEYESAGLAYRPANAAFQSIEELKLVFGMTPAIYERVAPLLTIYSRQPGINSQIAPREVLRALPGVTEAQIDEFLARREAARAAKLPVPAFPSPFANSFANLAVTQIRVEAKAEDGASFVREAIVQRLPNPRRSYTFLRWQEGRPGEPSSAPGTPTLPTPAADAPKA
ncbi:MAG: general secretion pathway protein GspK [Betaproteobacteria bacterium]|nr:general secretion pathway protein GspK [Betaproteobacteria bacterium]